MRKKKKDPTTLKLACNLGKSVKDLISSEEVLELAKKGVGPHYIFVNPLTGKEDYYFSTADTLDWLTKEYLHRRDGKTNDIPQFYYYDFELRKVSIDSSIPKELRAIKHLYKIPDEVFNPPPGVYFLYLSEELVYIGKSLSLLSRIINHKNSSLKEFDTIFFMPCREENLDNFEKALIKKYTPRYNVHISSSTKFNENIYFPMIFEGLNDELSTETCSN